MMMGVFGGEKKKSSFLEVKWKLQVNAEDYVTCNPEKLPLKSQEFLEIYWFLMASDLCEVMNISVTRVFYCKRTPATRTFSIIYLYTYLCIS